MIIVYIYGACLVFGLFHAVEFVYNLRRKEIGQTRYLKNKRYGE